MYLEPSGTKIFWLTLFTFVRLVGLASIQEALSKSRFDVRVDLKVLSGNGFPAGPFWEDGFGATSMSSAVCLMWALARDLLASTMKTISQTRQHAAKYLQVCWDKTDKAPGCETFWPIEYGFGYSIVRPPCTPHSIYFRGTVTLLVLKNAKGVDSTIILNPKP